MIEQEILPQAAKMGYSFTLNDLKAYGKDMKQTNRGCELSDSELETVTGGGWYCIWIGENYPLPIYPCMSGSLGVGG